MMKSSIRETLKFVAPLLLCIIIWELFVDLRIAPSVMLPAPSVIVMKMYDLGITRSVLWQHVTSSFFRFSIGYLGSILAGILLGIAMGLSKTWYKMFSPFVSLFVSLPTIAWVPLLLVFIGLGDTTIIIAIFLGGFFPMVYNTTAGIQSVPKNLLLAADMMGASPAVRFWQVIIPGSMVSIITGLKLGIGNAWRALVGAEMLAATAWGLGYLIYTSRTFYDIQAMFVGLVMIGLISLLVDTILIKVLEKRTILRWGMVRG